MFEMAPNGAGSFFSFRATPDLADMLGHMDLDFENFHCFGIFDFWISRFPDFQAILAATNPWKVLTRTLHGHFCQASSEFWPLAVMTPAHDPKPGE